MKNTFLFIFLFTFFISANAQITINSSDMPLPNDSIRISNALNTAIYNYATTGTNYNWNFNQLIAASQRSERFINVSSTPIIYNIVFFSKANLASKRDDMSVLNINITDGYNFYKNTNSDYRQVGYGASVNGNQVPVSFKSDDVIYRFPMVYGNVDSSNSEWEVNIPNLAYVDETIHRVNTVDGWGTITTPYGTFQCIRLKSEVIQVDTIYYTSTGMGMQLPQNFTEYIWLSKAHPFPILKATVPKLGGTATVEYIDSVKQFVSIETLVSNNIRFRLFPNPSEEGFYIKVQTSNNKTSFIKITDIHGKLIYEESFSSSFSKYFSNEFLSPGLYFVQIWNENQLQTKKIIIK